MLASLRPAELLFGHDPLDVLGLASDTIPQASIRLDRHAAHNRVDVRPDFLGAALGALTLMMNVVIDRKAV